jgi:hypothetical protein
MRGSAWAARECTYAARSGPMRCAITMHRSNITLDPSFGPATESCCDGIDGRSRLCFYEDHIQRESLTVIWHDSNRRGWWQRSKVCNWICRFCKCRLGDLQ